MNSAATDAREGDLLSVRSVSKRFERRLDAIGRLGRRLGISPDLGAVLALSKIDLGIRKGEIVGLAGESGCGKSTLGRIIAGLLSPSSGEVRLRGHLLTGEKDRETRKRALTVQMAFQDAFSSLNPRMTVKQIVGEAPLVHGLVGRYDIDEYIASALQQVGLDPGMADRYPHQFSGGQRQRIVIARALAVEPEFLICDESVAALDVSIQAQILNLFMDLRRKRGLTYLFISHDLGVLRHLSDRVVIMYLGRIVEEAPTVELFLEPGHPYTRALIDHLPDLKRRRQRYRPIAGELPTPLNPPAGCHFHPRCPLAVDRCRKEAPMLRTIAPGRRAACHLDAA